MVGLAAAVWTVGVLSGAAQAESRKMPVRGRKARNRLGSYLFTHYGPRWRPGSGLPGRDSARRWVEEGERDVTSAGFA